MAFDKDGQRIMGTKNIKNTDYQWLPPLVVTVLVVLGVWLSKFDNGQDDAVSSFVLVVSVVGAIWLVGCALALKGLNLLERVLFVVLPALIFGVTVLLTSTGATKWFHELITGDDGGTNPYAVDVGLAGGIVLLLQIAIIVSTVVFTVLVIVRLASPIKENGKRRSLGVTVIFAGLGLLMSVFLSGALTVLG